MPPLNDNRNTPEAMGRIRRGSVAAGALIHAGAMLMRDAAGDLAPATAATGSVGVGRAEMRVDNSGGAAGDETVDFVPGTFRYENSAGADEITAAASGALCYAVDDQTVALTDGGGARSPAGTVDHVDELGVWVRFDEALTRAAAA